MRKYYSGVQNKTLRVASATAIYNIDIKYFEQVKQLVENVIMGLGYIAEFKNDLKYIEYRIIAANSKGNERLTITQYSTGKLVLQGKTWYLWDELCSEIESLLECSVKQRIERVMVKPEDNISDKLIELSKIESRNKLQAAYKYLSSDEKNLVSSSLTLLASEVKICDYFAYMSPTAKALEGYLKRVLVDLNLITLIKARHETFKFSSIFDITNGIDQISLVEQVKQKITRNADAIEKELILTYQTLYKYRHNYFHGGFASNSITNKKHAEEIINIILDRINTSYGNIFDA